MLNPLNPYLNWCGEKSFFSKVLIMGVKLFELVFLLYICRGVLMIIFDILEQIQHQIQQEQ